MWLKLEERADKTELTYRPVLDPKEMLRSKIDKKDIIITVVLYVIMFGILVYNLL